MTKNLSLYDDEPSLQHLVYISYDKLKINLTFLSVVFDM